MGKKLTVTLLSILTTAGLVAPPTFAEEAARGYWSYNEMVEMPWWITALIISGGALLVWWFLPTKFTKTRKKSKKVEKRS